MSSSVVLVIVFIDPSDPYSVKYPAILKQNNSESNTKKHSSLLMINTSTGSVKYRTPVKQNTSENNTKKHSSLLMTNTSMTQTTSQKRTRNPLLERDRLSGSTPILSLNYSHVNFNLEKKKLLVLM